MNLANDNGSTVDNVYVTESPMLSGFLGRYNATPSSTTMARASLPPHPTVVLPEEAVRSHRQQPASLISLWQQMLQIISTQSNRSQLLAELATRIGKAFNVDGCAIVLPSTAHTKAEVVCWLADAPLLPMQPLEPSPGLFEGWWASSQSRKN